jgi:hypothetical protein
MLAAIFQPIMNFCIPSTFRKVAALASQRHDWGREIPVVFLPWALPADLLVSRHKNQGFQRT